MSLLKTNKVGNAEELIIKELDNILMVSSGEKKKNSKGASQDWIKFLTKVKTFFSELL
jgi:hypothetical protein